MGSEMALAREHIKQLLVGRGPTIGGSSELANSKSHHCTTAKLKIGLVIWERMAVLQMCFKKLQCPIKSCVMSKRGKFAALQKWLDEETDALYQ